MEASNLSYSDSKLLQGVVVVSSCLSVLGSLLIILSYVLCKETRFLLRTILLHISLGDLGVAVANLIYLSVDFSRFSVDECDKFCKIQGFFAVYFTLVSFLWTITLAAILVPPHVFHRYIMTDIRCCIRCFWGISTVICYSLPLLVSLWLVLSGKMVCRPLDSFPGWYSLRSRMDMDTESGTTNLFSVVFGYDLWVYLTMMILPFPFLLVVGCERYYPSVVSCMYMCAVYIANALYFTILY